MFGTIGFKWYSRIYIKRSQLLINEYSWLRLVTKMLEPLYQEALSIELDIRNIQNIREEGINIYYKGYELDKKYKMDIVVGNIIVELKSVVRLEAAHRAQLCNYMRLTKKPIGLLINFGESHLVGERWAYDEKTNDCFIVDKNMQRVFNKDYNLLLDIENSEY